MTRGTTPTGSTLSVAPRVERLRGLDRQGRCTTENHTLRSGKRTRGKRRITSPGQMIEAMTWHLEQGTGPVEGYQCWRCGAVHIGHSAKKPQEAAS